MLSRPSSFTVSRAAAATDCGDTMINLGSSSFPVISISMHPSSFSILTRSSSIFSSPDRLPRTSSATTVEVDLSGSSWASSEDPSFQFHSSSPFLSVTSDLANAETDRSGSIDKLSESSSTVFGSLLLNSFIDSSIPKLFVSLKNKHALHCTLQRIVGFKICTRSCVSEQCFSTGVLQNLRVLPVASRGSAKLRNSN